MISSRALNRATLARQMLLRRESMDVVDAVRRIVAMQAQHAASPYIALWNRLSRFDPAALDEAFISRRLVKGTLMRFTLHAVHSDDHPAMQSAMQPTLRARFGDPRYVETGVSRTDAEAMIPEVVELLEEPRTSAEIEAWVAERLGVPPKQVWIALRCIAPLVHAPTGGPWSFGQRPSFVATGAAISPYSKDESDLALQRLVLRYLEGFGPASIADVAEFAKIQRGRARVALDALPLEQLGDNLYDVPGGLRPSEDTPAPARLMPMWDSVLLAYADRSRIIPPEYRKIIIRQNGDFLPTLLVDGYVAGVWRTVEDGIEATAFHDLPQKTWKSLTTEARALSTFLAKRDPHPYSRYNHWWPKLGDFESRLLTT
jgi:hypothetical protein